jgi:hypothetical protein
MLADGGDCLSDLAVLRDQPELFGPVASTATTWRVIERLGRVGEQGWPGCGRPGARHRAAPGQGSAPAQWLPVIDLHATPITARACPGSTGGGIRRTMVHLTYVGVRTDAE